MTDIDVSIAAWTETLDDILTLGDTLTPEEWATPTECPGWSVKDVYAHLTGGEHWMAMGHPPLASFRDMADEPVHERRDTPAADVLAELRRTVADRQAQIAANAPNPDEPTRTAYGLPITVAILYRMRAYDAWFHDQDIRRAIGRPGLLDSAGARVTRDLLLLTLGKVVAKQAAAPPGSTVRFTVGGDTGFDLTVTVDDARRGHLAPATEAPATAHLRTDWETFARLSGGRIDPATAPVKITGDVALAARILPRLNVTP